MSAVTCQLLFFFYKGVEVIICIFLCINHELVSNAFIVKFNVEIFFKHFVEKRVLVCLKGPPLSPSNKLCNFFSFFFSLSIFIKKHLIPIQDFFHKNMHLIKKREIFYRKVFKFQRFSKVFPMSLETPYFEWVINPKTYLNHEVGSNFFS